MDKIDFKKELPQYKAVKNRPQIIDIPPFNYLMIDGKGNPNTASSYQQAIEALYTVAYTLKFMVKKGALGKDYTVLPLEGLWWADDMNDFVTANKDNWYWTMMIGQPDFITREMYADAISKAQSKKDLPGLALMRFEPFEEGLCGQVLHIGPYADEGPTIQSLHEFLQRQGYDLTGKHHEIYLSDVRKAAPEKLKTIIRQPAAKRC